MPELPRTFGDLVRSTREARQMSTTAAADATGIGKAFWSDIEHGRRLPKDETAEQMCRVIGADRNAWMLAFTREKIGTAAFNLVVGVTLAEVLDWAHEQSRGAQDAIVYDEATGIATSIRANEWHFGARHMADGLATWVATKRDALG